MHKIVAIYSDSREDGQDLLLVRLNRKLELGLIAGVLYSQLTESGSFSKIVFEPRILLVTGILMVTIVPLVILWVSWSQKYAYKIDLLELQYSVLSEKNFFLPEISVPIFAVKLSKKMCLFILILYFEQAVISFSSGWDFGCGQNNYQGNCQ